MMWKASKRRISNWATAPNTPVTIVREAKTRMMVWMLSWGGKMRVKVRKMAYTPTLVSSAPKRVVTAVGGVW